MMMQYNKVFLRHKQNILDDNAVQDSIFAAKQNILDDNAVQDSIFAA